MNLFNKLIALTLPFVPKPIVGFFSRHYIAGDHLEDAVKLVRELNSQGMMATLDVLGEEVKEKEQSLNAVDLYKSALKSIHQEKLDANISVKPTHMGLTIDKEFCFENIKELVSEAAKVNNFSRFT